MQPVAHERSDLEPIDIGNSCSITKGKITITMRREILHGFFMFTMGGVRNFDPIDCWNCRLPYVRTYPETWDCKECEKLTVLERYLLHDVYPFALHEGEWIPDLLASFLCFDYEGGARKRFLWLATERKPVAPRSRFTLCSLWRCASTALL